MNVKLIHDNEINTNVVINAEEEEEKDAVLDLSINSQLKITHLTHEEDALEKVTTTNIQVTMESAKRVLLYEFIGTTLISMTYRCCVVSYNHFELFMGYLLTLLLFLRVSGSHFNPLVTFAFMFRK